ncbi:hypothetical protein [Kitasatospora azatica]|uniref:hypothetical protein n=1 Tax=Kitasatospora azatica TaxID=58347 RepID=UPI000A735791|nr:hypothetical protein [Kitasatospora azatica]
MSSRMTIRVYRITATGKRVPLTRKRTVQGEPGYLDSPRYDQWPDCTCPRHAEHRLS